MEHRRLEDDYCEKGSARWNELFGPDPEPVKQIPQWEDDSDRDYREWVNSFAPETRGVTMANTCAYRAAANEAAAAALYVFYVGLTDVDIEQLPKWEDLPEDAKTKWKEMFSAGHREYRRVVKEEG